MPIEATYYTISRIDFVRRTLGEVDIILQDSKLPSVQVSSLTSRGTHHRPRFSTFPAMTFRVRCACKCSLGEGGSANGSITKVRTSVFTVVGFRRKRVPLVADPSFCSPSPYLICSMYRPSPLPTLDQYASRHPASRGRRPEDQSRRQSPTWWRRHMWGHFSRLSCRALESPVLNTRRQKFKTRIRRHARNVAVYRATASPSNKK